MAYAYCNNEDCEKDKWWLQKPPSEYSSGGPKCPECGTTRVSVGDGSAESQTEAAEAVPETPEPETTQNAQQPARRQQTQPAPSGGQLEAAEAGSRAADLVAGLGGSTPEEKAETQGKLFTAAGSMVANLGQRMAEQKLQNAKRAKEADQSSVQSVEDYVRCPECDSQITDLPPAGEQFRCPGCNALLESS